MKSSYLIIFTSEIQDSSLPVLQEMFWSKQYQICIGSTESATILLLGIYLTKTFLIYGKV